MIPPVCVEAGKGIYHELLIVRSGHTPDYAKLVIPRNWRRVRIGEILEKDI